MKRYLASLIVIGCFGVAGEVAAVTISEVAWMGTSNSPNHEWIELHNQGDAVSLEGWTLSDGGSLLIALSGTLSSQAYAVLERTSDDSVPGAAFLVYTGALVNTGATLTLRRADGSVADQVVGGENWQSIGGSNETKETAQRTSGGWVTGPPTPGADNVTSGTAAATEAGQVAGATATARTTSGSGVIRRGTKSETVKLTLADVSLSLAIAAQTVGYVNQTVHFTATPSGLGEVITNSLTYAWNFGDGSTSSAKAVQHAYRYPGTYAVTLYAAYGRHEQVAQFEITILPVSLALAKTVQGDIQIHNNAVYDIDISGYRLQGDVPFTFPPRSVILAKQTITLPGDRITTTAATDVALYDAKRSLVAALTSPLLLSDAAMMAESSGAGSAAVLTQRNQPVARVGVPPVVAETPFTFSTAEETPLTAAATLTAARAQPLVDQGAAPLAAAALAGESDPLRAYGPYVGLVLLIVLAALGLLTAKRRIVAVEG